MIAHQAKKMTDDSLVQFRNRFTIPVKDEDVQKLLAPMGEMAVAA
jgi:pyruvate dehydrogenase complex dehydrogenase (E1) component